MTTVYMAGGRPEARRIISAFVAVLRGGAPSQLATGVFLAIGYQALSDIQADFVRKAKGGAGEDGSVWPRLSPKTLAYSRRFGPGEQASLKRAAGLGRGHRLAPGNKKGLLTVAQLKRWRQIFASRLGRLAASKPLKEAKAEAAQIAWAVLKREGAKTKLEVFGNRPHEPLRDTGLLLNSLSLGVLGESSYSKPSGEGGEYQIFVALENGVVIGTNVPYAATHNDGDAKRGIPERRFIPKRGADIPAVWLERWTHTGIRAIARALEVSLAQGGAA